MACHAWGKQHQMEEDNILAALRKFATRGKEGNRFTIACTLGEGTLIKVVPKLKNGSFASRPRMAWSLPCARVPEPVRVRALQQEAKSAKSALDTKSKLDMFLNELIRSIFFVLAAASGQSPLEPVFSMARRIYRYR